MRALIFALAVALLVAGCSPWVVHFEPHSLRQDQGRAVKRALRVPPGDVETLAEYGAVPHGTLDLKVSEGWMLTDGISELHEKAAEVAAEKGATHFIYVAPEEVPTIRAVTGEMFGNRVTTVHTGKRLTGATYLLMRVPENKLTLLPYQLAPRLEP